jgi:hypothetical protein
MTTEVRAVVSARLEEEFFFLQGNVGWLVSLVQVFRSITLFGLWIHLQKRAGELSGTF